MRYPVLLFSKQEQYSARAVQSQFSNTIFSDYFAEDHFFNMYIKTLRLVTIGYFLPLRLTVKNATLNHILGLSCY